MNNHEPEKDKGILKYVPKSKRAWVWSCYKDSDGYWIVLHNGYYATRTDARCHVIHEDTIAQLRYQIGGIEIASDDE